MSRKVTRKQAEAILKVIETRFAVYLVPGAGPGDRPTLYDHEHEDQNPGCWSIVWEGNAPYGWVMNPFDEYFDENAYYLAINTMMPDDDAREFAKTPAVEAPKGVFCEPINNCILGIYPA